MNRLDHEKKILSVILRKLGPATLPYARQHLSASHFSDPSLRRIFELTCAYADQGGGSIMPVTALKGLMNGDGSGAVILAEQQYEAVLTLTPAADALTNQDRIDLSAEFKHAISQLRELTEEDQVGSALAKSMEILTKGSRVRGRDLRGPAAARDFIRSEIAVIDARLAQADEAEPILAAVPVYPSASLRGPLAQLVSSISLPSALVGGAGLGALAGVCGKASLLMHDESVQYPALWIPLVGQSGIGKSPALEMPFRAVKERERAVHETHQAALAGWNSEPRAERGAPPVRTRMCYEETITLEALARALDQAPEGFKGKGVIVADELATWLRGIGQYRRGESSDRSRWMSMWFCADWLYQRVGQARGNQLDNDILLSNPSVSVVGTLQPSLLSLLGTASDGFSGRFLLHYDWSQVADEWRGDSRVPELWTQTIAELYEHRIRPRQWELTGDALGLWRQAASVWKAQIRGVETDVTASALRKADVQCARVALAIAESLHPLRGGPLPAEAMASAIAITEFAMNCWRALPGSPESMASSRAEEVMNSAHGRLMTWLEGRPAGTEGQPPGTAPRPRATKREIQRWLREKASNVDRLIHEHQARFPGCVTGMVANPQGSGSIYVYAPERRADK